MVQILVAELLIWTTLRSEQVAVVDLDLQDVVVSVAEEDEVVSVAEEDEAALVVLVDEEADVVEHEVVQVLLVLVRFSPFQEQKCHSIRHVIVSHV
jgi:hypothetical protein